MQEVAQDGCSDSPVIPLLRPKVRKACSECRRSKSKCDQSEWPCKRCRQRNLTCDSTHVAQPARTNSVTSSPSPPFGSPATDDAPTAQAPPGVLQSPISAASSVHFGPSYSQANFQPPTPSFQTWRGAQEHSFETHHSASSGDHARELDGHYNLRPTHICLASSSATPHAVSSPNPNIPMSIPTGSVYHHYPSTNEMRVDETNTHFSDVREGHRQGMDYQNQEEHTNVAGHPRSFFPAYANAGAGDWPPTFPSSYSNHPLPQSNAHIYPACMDQQGLSTLYDSWTHQMVPGVAQSDQEQRSLPYAGTYAPQRT